MEGMLWRTQQDTMKEQHQEKLNSEGDMLRPIRYMLADSQGVMVIGD